MTSPLADIYSGGQPQKSPLADIYGTQQQSGQEQSPLSDIYDSAIDIQPVAPIVPEEKRPFATTAGRERQSYEGLHESYKKLLADPNLDPQRRARMEKVLKENPKPIFEAGGLIDIKPRTRPFDSGVFAENTLNAVAGFGLKGAMISADFALGLLVPSQFVTKALGIYGPQDLRRRIQEAINATDYLFPTEGIEGYLTGLATQMYAMSPMYQTAAVATGKAIASKIPRLARYIERAFTGKAAQRVAGQVLMGAPLDLVQIGTMPDATVEERAKIFALAQITQGVGAAVIPAKKLPHQKFLTEDNQPKTAPQAPKKEIEAAEAMVKQAETISETKKQAAVAKSKTRFEAKEALKAAVARRNATVEGARVQYETANPGKKFADLPGEERGRLTREWGDANMAGSVEQAAVPAKAPEVPEVVVAEAPKSGVGPGVEEIAAKLNVPVEEVKKPMAVRIAELNARKRLAVLSDAPNESLDQIASDVRWNRESTVGESKYKFSADEVAAEADRRLAADRQIPLEEEITGIKVDTPRLDRQAVKKLQDIVSTHAESLNFKGVPEVDLATVTPDQWLQIWHDVNRLKPKSGVWIDGRLHVVDVDEFFNKAAKFVDDVNVPENVRSNIRTWSETYLANRAKKKVETAPEGTAAQKISGILTEDADVQIKQYDPNDQISQRQMDKARTETDKQYPTYKVSADIDNDIQQIMNNYKATESMESIATPEARALLDKNKNLVASIASKLDKATATRIVSDWEDMAASGEMTIPSKMSELARAARLVVDADKVTPIRPPDTNLDQGGTPKKRTLAEINAEEEAISARIREGNLTDEERKSLYWQKLKLSSEASETPEGQTWWTDYEEWFKKTHGISESTPEARTAPESQPVTTRETTPTLPESTPPAPRHLVDEHLDELVNKEQSILLNKVQTKDPAAIKALDTELLNVRADRLTLLQARAEATGNPEHIRAYTEAYFDWTGSVRGGDNIFTKYVGDPPLDPATRTKLESVPPAMLSLENKQRLLADTEGRSQVATGAEHEALVAQASELRKAITDEVPHADKDYLLYSRAEINGAVGGFITGWIMPQEDENNRKWTALAGALVGFGVGRVASRPKGKPSLVSDKLLPQIKDSKQIQVGKSHLGFTERMRQTYSRYLRPWHVTEYGPLGKLTETKLPEGTPRTWGALAGQYIGPVEGWVQGQPKTFTQEGRLVDVQPYTAVTTSGQPIQVRNLAEMFALVDSDKIGLDKLIAAREALKNFSQGGKGHNLNVQDALTIIRQLPENYHIAADALGYFHQQLLKQMVDVGKLPQSLLAKLSTNVRYHEVLERVYGLKEDPVYMSPTEAFINQLTNHMRAAEIHVIENQLVDLYQANPEAMRWYMRLVSKAKKLPDGTPAVPSAATQARVAKLQAELAKQGTLLTAGEADALAAAHQMGNVNKNYPTRNIYRDGARMTFRVRPELNAMLESMRPPELTFWQEMAIAPARVLRGGIVNDPIFIGWMALRDQFQTALNSRYGFRPGIDGFIAMREAWKRSPEWKSFQLHGGGHPALAFQDVMTLERTVKTAMNPGNTAGEAAINALKQMDIASAWRSLITPVAESGRFGEYLRARGAGATEVEAAYAARSVTGNLQQIGTSARALSMMTPFLRASAQALDETWFATGTHPFRGARETLGGKPIPVDGRRAANAANYAAKAIGTIAIPSALLWAANKDDFEIEQLRRSVGGNRFWYVRMSDKTIVKVPKPIFDGQVWGTSIEYTLDKMYDDDPVTTRAWMQGIADDAFFNLLPTFGAVPMALIANRDPVSGAPITPMGTEGASPEFQTRSTTSLPANAIGEAISPVTRWMADRVDRLGSEKLTETAVRALSPAGIDFIIRNVGGTLRAEAVRGIGVAITAIEEKDAPPLDELPIIRRGFTRWPTTAAAALQEFYSNADRVNRVARNIAILSEAGDAVGITEEINQFSGEMMLIDLYAKTRADFAQMRQSLENVRSGPFTTDSKREFERMILNAMIQRADEVNRVASTFIR